MTKKLTKTDFLFIVSISIAILSLSIYLFIHPSYYDESFYAVIPYRLINGDHLVQHEWHLTQFSSLFTYIPVKIWLTLKGSSEGIIVFLRCLYFTIHSAASVLIYNFFKKHGNWAIVASLMFFTQAPYRIFGISYNSVFVLSVLFFTLCTLSVRKSRSKIVYFIAGICYACSCVCNPIYCFAYILYILVCVVWPKRTWFKNFHIKVKSYFINKLNKTEQIDVSTNEESYSCFFCKEAIFYSFFGILSVAAIAIFFFFATGGTINSIFDNIQYLLSSSEYFITSNSLFSKIKSTLLFFSDISLNMPCILPIFFLILSLDGKRKDINHRRVYISVSLIISAMYMLGIIKEFGFFTNFPSLPFMIFSVTCYMLTEQKNKILFHCMWIPSGIAALFQYISANTFLPPLGIVFAIANIAGVIFVKDLFNEIESSPTPKAKSLIRQHKAIIAFTKRVLCIGLCAQLLFHIFVLQYEQIPYEKVIKADSGPYSGIIMTKQQHTTYTGNISDLNLIKSINSEKEPILIVSCKNWMYLYADFPIATYSAWCTNIISAELLMSYYTKNPDKIPKYIYVDMFDFYNDYSLETHRFNLNIVAEMFEFSKEDLSQGSLLTVEKCKF